MSNGAVGTRRFLSGATLPFCEACGYRHYVEQLERALIDLGLEPANIAIVSDIGCVGAVDTAFETPHTMHTTHGRSVAFATGVEMADAILHDSRLKTIVAVGDGGAMAGLSHLLNAALLNVDVTVLVANNGLLGLSGGQPSSACPYPLHQTPSTVMRSLPGLDVCALAERCGAGFVARGVADDADLWRVMAKAIAHPGFAIVEVLVGCPRYASDSATELLATRARAQQQTLGVVADDATRAEFQHVYRDLITAAAAAPAGDAPLPQLYALPLRRRLQWVIAGSAGEQVEWAAGVLTRAAAISGAHVAQRNEADVPGDGFVVSDVVLSREEIGYVGREEPDVVVITSEQGLHEMHASGVLPRMAGRGLVVIDKSLPEADTTAAVIRVPLRKLCTPSRAAMAGILVANKRLHAVAERAMFAAIQMSPAADVALYRGDSARVAEHMG